jgi:hypothetical protein
MALPAVIKGGRNILKAKRVELGKRLLPFDDAYQVADTNAVVRRTLYKHPVLNSSIDGWSVQVPTEVERKTIKIPTGAKRSKDIVSGKRRQIEVLKNPTAQTLRRFVQSHTPDSWVDMGNVYGEGYEGSLRYFKDYDGNWYFWDGSEAIHWHVWKQLHPDKKSLFDTAAVHKITRPFSERLLQKDDVMKGRFTAESEWSFDEMGSKAAANYDPDNIEVYQAQQQAANREITVALGEKLPSDTLHLKWYKNDIEVLQNPSQQELGRFMQNIRREYRAMGYGPGEPLTRTTFDADGNKWVWRADQGTHDGIESLLKKEFLGDVELNQNPHLIPEKNRLRDYEK